MKSIVEPKDFESAHRWESLRSCYFRKKSQHEFADELQALADWYFQQICTPEPEETAQ